MKHIFYTLMLTTAITAAGVSGAFAQDAGATLNTDTDLSVGADTGINADTDTNLDMDTDLDTDADLDTDMDLDADTDTSVSTDTTTSTTSTTATTNTNYDNRGREMSQTRSQGLAGTTGLAASLETNEIQDIQRVLNDRGYYQSRIDGIWGPRTAAAVRKFQQDNGLDATGAVDTTTLTELGVNIDTSGSVGVDTSTQGTGVTTGVTGSSTTNMEVDDTTPGTMDPADTEIPATEGVVDGDNAGDVNLND